MTDQPRRLERKIFLYCAKCYGCAAEHHGPGAAKWADDHTLSTGHDVGVDAIWETRIARPGLS